MQDGETLLPFALTDAQKRVLAEIEQDMTSGKIMNRLVQGDVGSGKTAVAMLAAYWTIQNGYQAAMMAPTEVLARQHAASFRELLEPAGITVVLLTGSLTAKEKRERLAQVADGTAQMVIGTHAVIQKGVEFQKLGLAITDEQHRFGVRQRSTLAEKGENVHTLVMTATPIPRTLALILYGDLDISIIDELPPGRQKIDTLAVDSRYHPRIYAFIEKHVAAGRQAYVICPMIEENEKLEVQSVLEYTAELTEELPHCRVACVHGKMKAKEKQTIMDSFAAGEIDVLVSTTVVEVGINVPNATIMLIENAERFGLAQLHQLRGRVGRGAEKSYCILVSDTKTRVAKERMKTMTESEDGFVISEKDLKLRGPGEFFGIRQHGLPELKIADLCRDLPILKEAQAAAAELFAEGQESGADGASAPESANRGIFGRKTSGNVSFSVFSLFWLSTEIFLLYSKRYHVKIRFLGGADSMRVIAGAAKGHNLQTIEGLATRPTTDRIKETLFNIIAFDLPEASFLDLFSGSGAIGIEALSEERRRLFFVENAAECQKVIQANLVHTKLRGRARLLQTDALSALDRLAAEGKKFDIIFMDPPYEAGLYTSVLERIAENGLLKAEGYLIAEGSSQIALTIPKGMKILREKVYKTTTLTFLCAEEENV